MELILHLLYCTLEIAALMRGSKLEIGGDGCRRNTAQFGNSSCIFWAVEIFANNINSSTIELVSLKQYPSFIDNQID